ncbi:hypothetical protein CONPUDRAFT_67490 [Coniophora puteana RWD-64-598 SS2]|uniref:Uncharacterized protein n=1 Tax=Coniophora puteana (strain RWD-64-598) TaxID=741705 RepID=R7SDT8_CONPW|nr:uncharacterized protein CONPUDRAFT_67490 [Coniophora puteana RWD-64-598 SS2]EIW74331.1 hypothetical protein CONPUDRAFT_67490 [Coniophora puteana RWD-64-598 SS2]
MPKVLIANRGERWTTVALYTSGDTSHATFADEAVHLASAAEYMLPERILNIALSTQCTHVHPGYGFLSESPALAHLLVDAPAPTIPITFIGPAESTLRIASDKFATRELARAHGVPVAPGALVSSASDVRAFARGAGVGYPVIIKALDGGGGRGIRLVASEEGVEEAFERCVGESPSRRVFVEKALAGPGWKHVEVQVVGDGNGEVVHLWERECSVQRRFQKVVEIAPSRLPRNVVDPVLAASVKLAKALKYRGLGTFEFLLNASTHEHIFLEINPRVQVEHTVTEEITGIDLVRTQLLLSLPSPPPLSSIIPLQHQPRGHAIQLRLTAEDASRNFALSPGRIHASGVRWPGGHGVRVDTWLTATPNNQDDERETEWEVGTEFDALLAKIIIHSATWEETTARALRALRELRVGTGGDNGGVKTNADVLAGVLAHPAWAKDGIDTTWLERNLEDVLRLGRGALERRSVKGLEPQRPSQAGQTSNASQADAAHPQGGITIQPGTSFQLSLSVPSPASAAGTDTFPTGRHTITLASLAHNTFPSHLSGTLSSSLSHHPAVHFDLARLATAASMADYELARPGDSAHVSAPLGGKIVELHPALLRADTAARSEEGQETEAKAVRVEEGETVAVLSAMKMETAVRAPRGGDVVRRGRGIEVGAIVGEGVLLCVLEKGLSSRL